MERGWTKTNRIVRHTIDKLGEKFKKECQKNRVLFLHEADVQAYLYSEISKHFKYPVKSTASHITGTAVVHIETHVKGWGKEDILDLVICPRDNSIIFKGPGKVKTNYGNIGFYNAKIARNMRKRVCAIEIKYSRYSLKNAARGKKRKYAWRKAIYKDLRKLRRFGIGYFVFISNIKIQEDMRDQLVKYYNNFVKRNIKKYKWTNIPFYYCDPEIQEWL